jgi:cytochrome c oxidase cbb3-type subunit 3
VRFLAACLGSALGQLALGQVVLAQAPPPASFPAQMRPPGDPAVVARGAQVYTQFCRSCHGADLRGGDLGGPNLLRSQLVLNDKAGEAVMPVVRNGRVPAGGGNAMPALPLAQDDIRAVAEYLHSVIATAQPQGAPPAGSKQVLHVLTGNARAGKRYFAAHCATCHAAEGALAGIGSRVPDPELLQNSWVSGRRAETTGPANALSGPIRVTVKLDSGETISGALQRLDDFNVSLVTSDNAYHSYLRGRGAPRAMAVDVVDPLAPHRRLLTSYTDNAMHDVTAYLATLK